MRVESTDDPVAYRATVAGLLEADPLVNTVLLNVLANRCGGRGRTGAAATYLSVWDGDELVGAALCTPPNQMLLGAVPHEAIGLVAEAFARTNPGAPGVQGTDTQARLFAERWRELTGRTATVHHGLRLFRLGELRPAEAPGRSRPAVDADRGLVTDWFAAFSAEIEQPMTRADAAASANERLAGGRLWLWIDDDEPVCAVAHTAPQHGFGRIAPVYTPPEHRGHGYASALTAEVSGRIRDGGNEVCLFTDLRNETTNRIYTAVGYEPVADFVRYTFEQAIR